MTHHDPKNLQALIEDAAPQGADLSFRPMFGGILAYADGKPAASLSNMGLAVKLAGEDREALIAAGGTPLRYEPDSPPSKTYTLLPESMLHDSAAIGRWLELCIAGLANAPARRARKAR